MAGFEIGIVEGFDGAKKFESSAVFSIPLWAFFGMLCGRRMGATQGRSNLRDLLTSAERLP
jgi:hypothetical protein